MVSCQMLFASLLSTMPTRILIRYALFSKSGPPRRVDYLVRYGSTGVKCLAQGHNDTLPNSGTEPVADNLAITYLRSYPMICIATSWDDNV